jgi:hypothetical protein
MEPPLPPTKKPSKRKSEQCTSDAKSKRHRRDEYGESIRLLAEQVSEIKNVVGNMCQYMPPIIPLAHSSINGDEVDANVSGDLYSENQEPPTSVGSDNALKLTLNTVLKEPTVPKSSPAHVSFINSIHHFDSENWSSVRYSDVQKQYCSQPAFTDLEANDEIKPFDRFLNLSVTERGFAALTQALIKQSEAADTAFESLLAWSRSNTELTSQSLQDKLKELFIEGNFHKISNDALQLACGHRADLIQQRRDSILRSVKDKYFKETLRKIPPSSQFLFQKEAFSAAIDKHGGVTKAFWPARSLNQSKPAAQAGLIPSNLTHRLPSQGIHEPSNLFMSTPRPFVPPPAQGVQSFYPLGWREMFRPPRPSSNPQGKPSRQRSFRNQSPYAYQQPARGQGRNSGPNAPRREYQQKRKF